MKKRARKMQALALERQKQTKRPKDDCAATGSHTHLAKEKYKNVIRENSISGVKGFEKFGGNFRKTISNANNILRDQLFHKENQTSVSNRGSSWSNTTATCNANVGKKRKHLPASSLRDQLFQNNYSNHTNTSNCAWANTTLDSTQSEVFSSSNRPSTSPSSSSLSVKLSPVQDNERDIVAESSKDTRGEDKMKICVSDGKQKQNTAEKGSADADATSKENQSNYPLCPPGAKEPKEEINIVSTKSFSVKSLENASDKSIKELLSAVFAQRSSFLKTTDLGGEANDWLKQVMQYLMEIICESENESFSQGFQGEWQRKQYQRILSSRSATKAAFTKQIEEQKKRGMVAYTTWLYQTEKMQKRLEEMKEQLENTNEGIAEYEAVVKRFHADPDTITCAEELHKTFEILLNSSIMVRMAKDKCFMTEMNRRTDATLCIVCQENQKQVFFHPCKHLALCNMCFGRLPKKQCPLCRCKVQSHSQVIL